MFMLKRFTLLTLLSAGLNSVVAQLDTKHFIPPMFAREDFGTHYIILSTPEAIPFDVTITDGTGTLITTQTISSASSSIYNLGTGTGTQFLCTEPELNTALINKGLILSAPKAFFANVRVVAGAQAGILSSKGQKAALGQDFRTGHLYNNNGDAFRKSAVFSIMATEDNTNITITDIRPGVIFRGTTATGAPLTSPDATFVLNEGECYVVAAFMDEAGSTQNVNGVNGTHIISDKDIAVNTGQWLGGSPVVGGLPSTGRDLGIDQIVPVDNIGNEYVVIKGEGVDAEKIIVVATVDNTDVMINGVVTPVATINAGDYYVIDGSVCSAFDNLYIQTSEDAYVYQTANGSDGTIDDNERQQGLNFLPPIGCSGSLEVIMPMVNFIGTAYINIIANTGAAIYVEGVPLGAGDPVTGTPDYRTYKLTAGYTGDITVTSDDLIRVALINLSGNIGAAGYFSGFTKDISVLTETVLADGIALEGCIPASFTFSIDASASTDTEISYTVAGSATNGIDYEYIDTVLIIPAGSTDATIYINSISDGFAEGAETIYIIYQPDECSELDTAELIINDAVPIEFSLDGVDLNCYGDGTGEIIVSATGGFPAYSYEVTTDAGAGTTTTYTSSPITGMPAGEYSVSVFDSYGCSADALVIGGIFDADTTFLPDGTGATYSTDITISGFGSGAILDDMGQLQQICMTMEHSYLGDLEIKIIAPSGEEVILKQFPGGASCDLGEPYASGPVDGSGSSLTDPGVGFEYCFNDAPIFGTMVSETGTYFHTITASGGGTYTDDYLPAGAYTSYENLDGLLGCDLDGTWTLEITDNYALDNGYIFTWNISLISDLPDTLVTINEPAEIVINSFITEATCGGSDGAINIAIIGDYPPYTFLWSNAATTEDISGLSAGPYTVWVTDASGCVDSMSFLLNNTTSVNITTSVTDASCPSASDGAIDVTPSGGTPGYTYSWSSGPTTQDISSIGVGTYTITVTDAVGCIYAEDILVSSNPAISIFLAGLVNEECGDDDGSIDIEASGGSGSYGYSWSSGPTTQDISGLTSGTYDVTVIDAEGCAAVASYVVANDVSSCSDYCFLDAVAVLTSEDCGNGEGAIDLTISDAGFPYTVLWNTGATTEDLSSLSAGDYTVTINDVDGCEHIETFTVTNETSTLDLSSFTINDENCGSSDGTIDITIAGGTLPYSYAWSTSASTEDVSGLAAGSYSVTVTDGNGCSFTPLFVVNNNTGSLSYSYLVTNELCGSGNGSVNLTLSGEVTPVDFLWTSGSTSEDIAGLSAGTYSCTITDGSGCTLETIDFVVINSAGTLAFLSIVPGNENCDDNLGYVDLTMIDGTTPYSYVWSTSATTEDISSLDEGTYSCTVTDAGGCSVSTGPVVIYNASGTLDVSTDLVMDEVCNGDNGAIFITTTGGTSPIIYSWSDGSTSEDNIDLTAGNYTLTATDAVGCITMISETVINTSGTLSIVLVEITDESCGSGNGAVDITISGGTAPITYLWSTTATTQDVSGLSEGTYDVVVTDAGGCEQNASAAVFNNAGTLSSSFIATAEICSAADGSIDLSISGGAGGYTYLWSSGPTTQDISGLSAGTYSCEITDAVSCSINTGAIVLANNPGTLGVSEVVTDETCGDGAGAVDLTVSGGTAGYTYLWSTAATTEDISSLIAGTYDYTVTDASGCEINGSVDVINSSGTLSLDAVVVTDENCDDDLGAIDITVSGGTGPYTFLWNTADITEDLTALDEGTYSVDITDAGGCTISSGSITVSDMSTMSLTEIEIDNEDCGNGIGSVDITISGGTAPLTYLWSNAATTEDVILLSAGIYTCTITDAGGCELDISATVLDDPGTLSIFGAVVTDEACGSGAGSIDITVAGGTGGYTYSWSNSATTQDVAGLSADTYTILLQDGIGCTTTDEFVLNNSGGDLIIASTVISDEICGDVAGAVDISLIGGEAPYSFAWDNGAVTEDLSSVSAGDYILDITDINGCALTDTFTVGLDNGDLAITSTVVTPEVCGNGLGAVNISFTGGSGPYDFDWDNGATTEDISGLSAGAYNLVLTDENGCEANTSGTVINMTGGFSALVTSVTDESCGDGTGAVDISVAGGTTPYSFLWSTSDLTEDVSGLSEGTYSVTVSDATGCMINLSADVLNNTGTLIISAEVVEDEDCADGTGFIDITVTGGTAGYTYLWSTSATTQDISGLSAATYTCTITDGAGCILNYSAVVDNSSGTLATDVTILDENCGAGNGQIIVDVSGGINPYDFSWTGETAIACCEWNLEMYDEGSTWNGASLQIFANGIEVGDFTVTGGGENFENFDICDGDTVELIWNDGTSDEDVSFYLYDSEGTLVYSHAPGVPPIPGLLLTTYSDCPGVGPYTTSIDGLSAGTYELVITDDVGCVLTETYTVGDVASDISIVITSVIDENCGASDGEIAYTITGGVGPFVTTANGFTDGPPIGLLQNLYSGNWEIITIDANGCTDTINVFVDNTATFTSSAIVTNDWCGQGVGAIDVSVSGTSGTVSYDWDFGPTTPDVSGLTAGTYTVTITDAITGPDCVDYITVIVNDSTDIIVSATSVDELCGDSTGSIDLTIVGETDVDIVWSHGPTTEDVSGLTTGSYTCTVTSNVSGCQEIIIVNITSVPDFAISAVITDEFCMDSLGSIDVTITGSLDMAYLWETGDATEDIDSLTSGDYWCTFTNNESGCVDSAMFTVNNTTTGLDAFAVVTDEICGALDGAIDVTITFAFLPPSFEWSTTETTEDIGGLAAGDYWVIITDGFDGCQMLLPATVGEANAFDVVLTGMVDAVCATCATGTIDISIIEFVSGVPYTFDWDNGETTEDISGLLPGTYTVIVTNSLGCTDTLTVVVGNSNSVGIDGDKDEWMVDIYPNPTMDQFVLNYNFNGSDNVTMTINSLTGQVVRRRTISNGKGTLQMNVSDLESGVYWVRLTDGEQVEVLKFVVAR